MTLFDFSATLIEYAKIRSGKEDPMTDKDYDSVLNRLRSLNLPDVRV